MSITASCNCAGAAARKLKLMEGDIVVGIPLSASEKSIYFDRPPA
jgi:uncharacterized ferredoxin-like protein